VEKGLRASSKHLRNAKATENNSKKKLATDNEVINKE